MTEQNEVSPPEAAVTDAHRSHLVSHDMTEGNIVWRLLQFAWPLLVGNIFQQLYTTVNSIIVGNFIGSAALAAVGVYTPIFNLLLGLFNGIATGATVLVSQSFGAKDEKRLNHAIYISIVLTILVGFVITILGLSIAGWLLRAISTPENIFQMALMYSRIMFIGILPVLMYNILCGVLRGMGDSVKPLLFLIVANILNAGLDYVFIVVLGFGVEGAAYATLIAQSVSAVWAFIYLLRSQDRYGICLRGLKPDWRLGREMISIGLPTGLQGCVFNIGFILQQNLINSFGQVAMASYVIVTRIDPIATLPMNSVSIAITTFVGQNVGAHKLKRAQKGIKDAFWLSQVVTVVLVAGLFFFGPQVMSLFTTEQDVIMMSTRIIRIFCTGYIMVNAYIILSGAVRGVGDTMAPLMASFSCNVILRVSLAYLMVYLTGRFESIFYCIVLAWTLCSVFMTVYYRKGHWRLKVHY